ncbi:MAG: outer membrane lipoprotein carrier protein LolA [Gemmatimonadetes bacterium]|uniref:Outer membrane lipoprotein carrier protein LolA n=1 Tax=Candidatus Kutchimonas denitrificans TaxID=3056748 RepID=A0AAE4ZAN7_9BACT|nr:outer membrane lipoprotein carrier protein LolA [Gemmatimonadota bacterium]NIR73930.1 outer membrane lipoprotein carrier protein LolA [Candidatus Kutchimonas denitrificans]NIR99736.1 outer membrane lipoprotein carrier protein LolA [Gemmatimonadota bacterium]NIT65321.1 outer membrane lipoprotein carrier protein LolA [Gemmatimonadota bacterium]NIW73770.1 outer membrane lipoprotein-sorting protein [Gemmatimonadota bacterium]
MTITANVLAFLAILAPQAGDQGRAEEVLVAAARAYEAVQTLKSDFSQRIEIPALETEKEGRGIVYQKKPNYFRMQFTEPAGDVVVADGQWFWMYYPSAQPDQVVRTRINPSSQSAALGQQFLVNPTERYVATYVESQVIDGRAAHLLALVPKFDAPYTLVRVWIDAEDYLVRKFEIHEENETVRTITLSNVEAGIDLSDDLFSFTPPAGVEVFTR